MTTYSYKGPVDCTIEPDLTNVNGKSAIVTGGASGIGKGYVEALAKAGAFVTIGDINEEQGTVIAKAHPGNVQFVKCDVRSWEDQLQMFKSAFANSPSKSVDIVVANAGTNYADPMSKFEDADAEPEKPDLKILDINLYGVMYTTKLAFHYFQKHSLNDKHDRCLIVQTSIAAYMDLPGSIQYQVSKYGGRGLMVCARNATGLERVRINTICPWFVPTPLVSGKTAAHLQSKGIKFATIEDCAQALLRIAADASINGRAFAILPRDTVREGFLDLDMDDYKEGSLMAKLLERVKFASHRVVVWDPYSILKNDCALP